MRHFTSLSDWSDEELKDILHSAQQLKQTDFRQPLAAGKILGLLFFNPSLRTRVSFETAATHLGAATTVTLPGQGSWNLETEIGAIMNSDKQEHVKEAIQVLSQYVDTLGVRTFAGLKNLDQDRRDCFLRQIVSYATVPVINLESAWEHPCQGLADWLTLLELLGENLCSRKMVLTWAPHPKPLPGAVPHTVLEIASRCGLGALTLACPPEMLLDDTVLQRTKQSAESHGTVFHVSHDQEKAFAGADVIYAKAWAGSLVYTNPEKEKALREKYHDWIVTPEKMTLARHAKFMHCLPVRRNVVVTDTVLDGPAAVHIQQAGNRLHVQKALLMKLWHLK